MSVLAMEDMWGPVRALLSEAFSASVIRAIAGSAGMVVDEIVCAMPPQYRSSTYKEPFLQAADIWMGQQQPRRRALVNTRLIEEILQRQPSSASRLEAMVAPQGWGVSGDHLYPVELQSVVEMHQLPTLARDNIGRAIARYRDGDNAGALTSLCGAVDALTAEIYTKDSSLGDHWDDDFQKRVVKAFRGREGELMSAFGADGCPSDEANRWWNNLRGAVNQAAYVMASLRRNFSDAHGNVKAPQILVQAGLDAAVFISRNLASSLG